MKNLEALAKEGRINENASIKDSHSIIINAPIIKVWDILSNISQWPDWNKTIKRAEMDGDLKVDKSFNWVFDRTKYTSVIQHLEPAKSLSWTGKSSWIKSIHVWQLEDDDNQTIATLSTSLEGKFTVLVNKHQKVYNDLIGWLEDLKAMSER